MSNLKISQLPPATTPLAGTELLAVVQSGETRKVAASQVGVPATIYPDKRVVVGDGVTKGGTTSANFQFDQANFVESWGINAAATNSGSDVVAIGQEAAQLNTGSGIVALGLAAAKSNRGSNNVVGIGTAAAFGNRGSDMIAIGQSAGVNNTGISNIIGIGASAASGNSGNHIVALGNNAGGSNSGDNVIAIGRNAGIANPLTGMFIISNDSLPSYVNWAAANAAISPTGIAGNTYLYYDEFNQNIGAVRL